MGNICNRADEAQSNLYSPRKNSMDKESIPKNPYTDDLEPSTARTPRVAKLDEDEKDQKDMTFKNKQENLDDDDNQPENMI